MLVRLFILKTGHLTIHFRKRNIYLGSQFQRVWSMVASLHDSGQKILVEGVRPTGDFFTPWQPELRVSGRDHEQDVPKDTPTP